MPKGLFGTFRGRPATCHPDKPNYSFGLCRSCKQKEDYVRLPIETRKDQRLKRYGITFSKYNELLISQNNSCAICGSTSPRQGTHEFFHVDHNHKTGEVRGLLCGPCNRGLGYLGDNPDRVIKAYYYLIRDIKL